MNDAQLDARLAAEAANLQAMQAALAQAAKLPTPTQLPEMKEIPALTAFERRAQILIDRNIPVAPVQPLTKQCALKGWPDLATTDISALKALNPNPNANTAAVAKAVPGGFCFLDIDRAGFREVIEKEAGHKFPDTFMVRSSPGKGHLYFRQTPATLALGKQVIKAKDENGELWSFRLNNAYVVGPNSAKDTGDFYTIIKDAPIADCPDWFTAWAATNENDAPRDEKVEAKVEAKVETKAPVDPDDLPIPSGSRNNALTSILGKARQTLGMDKEQLCEFGLSVNRKRCVPPLSDAEVRTIANSIGRYDVKDSPVPILGGKPAGTMQTEVAKALIPSGAVNIELPAEASSIPAFDDSVITGIFREIVDLATNGTTIPRQFSFLSAKVYMGALMAGKTTFEGLDCDSSYYGCPIGVTGTSKGESWRRTVERILQPDWDLHPGVKILQGVDSGAGLKDAFFDPPKELPIICYVDEVVSLGHKAGEKKNPEIVDQLIELADSHRVSRVKAQRGKQPSTKTHDNARLSTYICGQSGDTFMSAFPGRKSIGLLNRLYPEFSDEIYSGKLPSIPNVKINEILLHIRSLKLNVHMTMSSGVNDRLDEFWEGREGWIKRGVRFKKYLTLDMYMNAFGCGRSVAEQEDLQAAIKIFNRQMVIRKVCFAGEIPDRTGFYAEKIKLLLGLMKEYLKAGRSVGDVAMSLRDFHYKTHAYRDNELPYFNRAWKDSSEYIASVKVRARNGQDYVKYVPAPEEDETWHVV